MNEKSEEGMGLVGLVLVGQRLVMRGMGMGLSEMFIAATTTPTTATTTTCVFCTVGLEMGKGVGKGIR